MDFGFICIKKHLEQTKTIFIDEVGSSEFMIFNEKDKEILHKKYRIICENISETQNTSNFLPILVLPEQVQILFENGYVKIRRIHKLNFVEPITSTELLENDYKLKEQKKSKILIQARQVIFNQKIKKSKEKNFEFNISSKKSKIKKIYKNNFENASKKVTEEKLNCIVDKLLNKKIHKLEREKRCYAQKNSVTASKQCYRIVENPQFPKTAIYRRRVITFRDLWRKGFYLTSGIKFGCDYLAYEKSPCKIHAKFMVICMDSSNEKINESNSFNETFSLNLISAVRVASQVKKQILLSIVSPESLIPYYIQCNWWKGNR